MSKLVGMRSWRVDEAYLRVNGKWAYLYRAVDSSGRSLISCSLLTATAKREQTLLVTSDVAISFLGLENARVLSTPHMIGNMEINCRNLVVQYLDPGHDTVGTHVDVYHLAAAPMGATVTFRAEILGVDDRRVRFKVECFDDKEKLGEGTHERTVINVARFTAKMAAKAQNASPA